MYASSLLKVAEMLGTGGVVSFTAVRFLGVIGVRVMSKFIFHTHCITLANVNRSLELCDNIRNLSYLLKANGTRLYGPWVYLHIVIWGLDRRDRIT